LNRGWRFLNISALNPEDYMSRTICARNAAPEADIIGIRRL